MNLTNLLLRHSHLTTARNVALRQRSPRYRIRLSDTK